MNSNNNEPIVCNYCPKILTKLNEINKACTINRYDIEASKKRVVHQKGRF
jgi:hypothetical protein